MSSRKRAIAKAKGSMKVAPYDQLARQVTSPFRGPDPNLTFNMPVRLDAASAQTLGMELLKMSGVHGTLII